MNKHPAEKLLAGCRTVAPACGRPATPGTEGAPIHFDGAYAEM
jgi:hypothetical protein